MPLNLILYSKPGCHLCEGLLEKLQQLEDFPLTIEVRDITTQASWFERYQYEIPVLCLQQDGEEKPLPRLSPRVSVTKLQQMLQKYQD